MVEWFVRVEFSRAVAIIFFSMFKSKKKNRKINKPYASASNIPYVYPYAYPYPMFILIIRNIYYLFPIYNILLFATHTFFYYTILSTTKTIFAVRRLPFAISVFIFYQVEKQHITFLF